MPNPRSLCKYTDLTCQYNYVDEFGDPTNRCFTQDGNCIYKIYPDEKEDWDLQKAILHSPFWTLWGCDRKGTLAVDETIIAFIKAISGDATEPNSGLYKNPDAMYNALDLIYMIIDEAQENNLTIRKEQPYTNEPGEWKINKIESIVTHESRSQEVE